MADAVRRMRVGDNGSNDIPQRAPKRQRKKDISAESDPPKIGDDGVAVRNEGQKAKRLELDDYACVILRTRGPDVAHTLPYSKFKDQQSLDKFKDLMEIAFTLIFPSSDEESARDIYARYLIGFVKEPPKKPQKNQIIEVGVQFIWLPQKPPSTRRLNLENPATFLDGFTGAYGDPSPPTIRSQSATPERYALKEKGKDATLEPLAKLPDLQKDKETLLTERGLLKLQLKSVDVRLRKLGFTLGDDNEAQLPEPELQPESPDPGLTSTSDQDQKEASVDVGGAAGGEEPEETHSESQGGQRYSLRKLITGKVKGESSKQGS
ncbi:hypothetical protein QBC38DRAFT_447310 [Podospora fimiseda]|uniref:Uncharacterized protein n=1 Tax=Podospora fimiseda TaxID=252190 RepID=A0AAN7GXE2_9PEZI|nr:hypothetical protein QBC38DRAFT_447310 [Podospora fimiseda]